ncbi:hypothetical protein DSO57_1022729 [Entomophthora muscae]|uniref:Uncharacterized protein n=1 Tax=Entomophthora muscae TaxID=34485 RepID=A0ACC2S4Z2_9FUNG|nr:hypothetical protein DSO57_1022729 [Entomophthora muscae]
MTTPSSQSLATIQDTLWGLVDRNPTVEIEQREWAAKKIMAVGTPIGPSPPTTLTCILQMRLKPATYNELCSQIEKRYKLFPSVFIQGLSDLVIFYASYSDKSRKDSCLLPCPFVWFVKTTYAREEEFEQLKQSALAAPSQSTNPASPTPHQATCLPTLTPKPPPISSPLSLMTSLSQVQMKATFIPPIPSSSCPLMSKIKLFFVTTY